MRRKYPHKSCEDCGKTIRGDSNHKRCRVCASKHIQEIHDKLFFQVPGTDIWARKDIAQVIFDRQVVHLKDVKQELNLGRGTLYDALKVLEGVGYVKRTKEHLPYNADKKISVERYMYSLGIIVHYEAVQGARGRPYTVLHWIGPALPDLLAATLVQ